MKMFVLFESEMIGENVQANLFREIQFIRLINIDHTLQP